MAYDFPANPTVGQTFQNYIWNGTAWAGIGSANNLGVQVAALQTIDQTNYHPNYVINGGFDIWQRGTSAAINAGNTYKTADRWVGYKNNSGATESRQNAGLDGFTYSARYQRNSGSTDTSQLWAYQTLETVMSVPLAGKTVTLSFYAKAGANYSATGSGLIVQLRSGTGTDQNALSGFTGSAVPIDQYPTITTTWKRFSYTVTLNSNITQLGVVFIEPPTGTAGANDWFEITGVQLEEGAVATPFRRAGGTIQGELAACQRYYYRTPTSFSAPAVIWSGVDSFCMIPFPTTMRSSPAVPLGLPINTFEIYYPTQARIPTSYSIYHASPDSYIIVFTYSGGGMTPGYSAWVKNSGATYIEFTSEL